MRLKVFLACPIDLGGDFWKLQRRDLTDLCRESGYEVISAGLGSNPIISSGASRRACKVIMNHDLTEQRKAHVTLVATELSEFSVGTWIEMWEGYRSGQFTILFVVKDLEVRSVFLKGLADEIIINDDAAVEHCLRELQREV